MSASDSHSNRRNEKVFRTRLLILPKFQLTLIGVNWSVITLVFGVLYLQMSEAFSELSPLVGLSGNAPEFFGKTMAYHSHNLQVTLLASYAVAMVASGLITLGISYRFAGPLIRLRGYFRDISEGTQPVRPLSFRSGDFFSDLPPLVNGAIGRISGHHLDDPKIAPKKIHRVS